MRRSANILLDGIVKSKRFSSLFVIFLSLLGCTPPNSPPTRITVPSVPTEFTAVATAGSTAKITLSWKAPATDGGAAISGYTLTREEGPNVFDEDNKDLPIIEIDSGVFTYEDGGATAENAAAKLEEGTGYRYQLFANNSRGSSESTQAIGYTADVPAKVSDLTATSTPGQVTLTWAAPAANGLALSGYSLERRKNILSAWDTYTELASLAAGETSYLDATVVAGSYYQYQLIATNGAGDSEPSDPRIGYTVPGVVPPFRVGDVAVEFGEDPKTTILLSWTPPRHFFGGVEPQFKVWRKETVGGTYELLLKAKRLNFYIDRGLRPRKL